MTQVHKDQENFRKILEAISYPGKAIGLEAGQAYKCDLSGILIDCLRTLVDGEVKTHISNGDRESFREIAIRTNTENASLEEADFIVVPKEDLGNLAIVIEGAKKGGYVDPDKNGTILVEVESFEDGGRLIFEGPGIEDQNEVILPQTEAWLEARNKAVEKFPMGVDIFFISLEGKIIGLPRTTKVKVLGE